MVDTSSGKILAQTETLQSTKGAWSLFWEADLFVQLIMIALLFGSIWSWSVIFKKIRQLYFLRKSTTDLMKILQHVSSLEKVHEVLQKSPQHLLSRIFSKVMSDFSTRSPIGSNKETMEMLSYSLDNALRWEISTLQRDASFLATLGSTAPFIGLLGTVWGIMHSFQSIATSQNTNLAVVAPGIAEALAATALGLIAAIPAVVAYNRINAFLNTYSQMVESFNERVCLLYLKHIR